MAHQIAIPQVVIDNISAIVRPRRVYEGTTAVDSHFQPYSNTIGPGFWAMGIEWREQGVSEYDIAYGNVLNNFLDELNDFEDTAWFQLPFQSGGEDLSYLSKVPTYARTVTTPRITGYSATNGQYTLNTGTGLAVGEFVTVDGFLVKLQQKVSDTQWILWPNREYEAGKDLLRLGNIRLQAPALRTYSNTQYLYTSEGEIDRRLRQEFREYIP